MFRKLVLIMAGSAVLTMLHGQKVGLVLSGGGAKGFAHIGVIEAMEENNIPVDYITGTSMGAVVGAMYAMGYSPEDMRRLVGLENFRQWATGVITQDMIYNFKQGEKDASMFRLRFSINDSASYTQWPTNIIQTHAMDYAFMRMCAQAIAYAQYDFDRLFVPFRCVAADIYKNEAVVMKSGDLASAVRVSATFPFWYRPISIDSVVYFDGGLYNNFPVDIMMNSFHPDVVIGSKTVKNAERPDEEDVLSQIENMLMRNTDFTMPEENGILIETKFENVGLFDFEQADSLIEKGKQKAEEKMEIILEMVNRRMDKKELDKRRKNYRENLPDFKICGVSVQGINIKQEEHILKNLERAEKDMGEKEIRREYFKLISDERIKSAYPVARYDTAKEMFRINLKVRERKKWEVELGGNISSSSINQGYAAVGYNTLGYLGTKVKGNVYFGRLYSSVALQTRIDFPGKIPFYLQGGMVMNRLDYFSSSNEPFFEDVRPAYIIQDETNVRMEVGFPAGMNGKIKTGLCMARMNDEYYQSGVFMKTDTADKSRYNSCDIYLGYESSTLNKKQHPYAGKEYKVTLKTIRGRERTYPGSTLPFDDPTEQDYEQYGVHMKGEQYFELGDVFSLGLKTEIQLMKTEMFNNYISTMLKAKQFESVPVSKTIFMENYRANNFAAAGIVPVIKFTENMHLRGGLYIFQPYRKIKEGENKKPVLGGVLRDRSFLMNAALVYHTPAGPGNVSINYFEKEGKKLYVQFNFGYILFNRRGDE